MVILYPLCIFFLLSLCRDCLFCTYTEFLGAFSLFFSVTVLLFTFLNFRCQCFFVFVLFVVLSVCAAAAVLSVLLSVPLFVLRACSV